MRRNPSRRWPACALALAAACTGCGSVLPRPVAPPAFYVLDGSAPGPTSPTAGALTLIVNRPQAAAGFDTPQIVYLRQPQQLEHFAHSQWVAPPARLLAPLIAAAATRGGRIGTAVAPSAAPAADLRLDTQLLRLQQDFRTVPSRVRLTLQATLLDDTTHRVLATRAFDAVVAAPSDDAAGGVRAAQVAVDEVMAALAAFCDDAARRWMDAREKRQAR